MWRKKVDRPRPTPGPCEVDLSECGGPGHLRWGGGEGGNKNKKTRGARGGPGSECHETFRPSHQGGRPRGRGPPGGVDGPVGRVSVQKIIWCCVHLVLCVERGAAMSRIRIVSSRVASVGETTNCPPVDRQNICVPARSHSLRYLTPQKVVIMGASVHIGWTLHGRLALWATLSHRKTSRECKKKRGSSVKTYPISIFISRAL